MKHDLTNLTFTIPVRIDSQVRQNNIAYTIDYLTNHFDTKIIVYENGPEPLFENKHNVQHFYEKNDGAFHRTKYLNRMARMSNTDYISNYDCDVFFPVKQIVKAYELLQKGEVDFIYPYDGLFVNIQHENVPPANVDAIVLDPSQYHNFGNNSMGGAVFWSKKAFIDGGMENENFISWGCEDWERFNRFCKLGYKVGRVKGPLYHQDHPRFSNSNESNPHYQGNLRIFHQLDALNAIEMKEELKNWPWLFS